MSGRPALAALLASLALAAGATACSSSSGGPTGPAAASPRRAGAVQVDPESGPVGTMFGLSAEGLTEGDVVAFEITFPGEGKAYPGATLTVAADGTVATTYRATVTNLPGEYVVRLTGAPGTLAEGRFVVTDGPPLTSTTSIGTSTLGSSTTVRTGPTSTRLGRTTTTTTAVASPSPTSTIKAPVTTTATTRRSTTTTAKGTTTTTKLR